MSSTEHAIGAAPSSRGLVRSTLRMSGLCVAFLTVCVWALLGVFPLYWAIVTSLKSGSSVAQLPPKWIPTPFSLGSWKELFNQPYVLRWVFNSVIVATVSTAGTVLFSTMAGYAFAKGRFAGQRILFAVVIAMLMVSSQVLIVPLFIIMRDVHLLDSYLGLILPGLASPFAVFLAKQFIQTLPNEIFDAARVDGSSEVGIFFRMVMPLSRPVMAIIAIFSFLSNWSEFIYPLIITTSDEMRTLPVGLTLLQDQFSINYSLLMAAALLTAAPPLIIFLIMQRSLVKGMTFGAVKG
jgi:multiple sugar transport system permease protein